MSTSVGCLTSACRYAAAAAISRADVTASAAAGRTDVSHFASYVGNPIRRQTRGDALSFRRNGAFSAESWTRGAGGSEMPTFSRGVGLRRFQVVSPVCMGRRSSKIATRKNAQDARKSKLYGKFGKQIISAVKAAGPSPASNSALAALLVAAKQGGVPKDVIDRNIKRATEKGQADFTEIVYEIYGLGGVGIVVDVLTDNNARAAATVRDVVRKGGAKMADPGSVLFNFKRQGVLAVPAATADPDEVLVVAVDAGADDVINPGEDIAGGGGGGHAEEGEEEEQFFRVLTPAESFASVRAELQEYGLTVDAEHSGLMFIPTATMQPDEEAREQNEAVMEKLLELDDVDAVYCNQ